MRTMGCGILLGCLVTAGCVRKPPEPALVKPPKIEIGLPVTQEITDYEDFTGRTEAMASVDVRARATGYLVKVNFKDGDQVKEGDELFEIDPRPYQAELNKAKAALVQAKALRNRLEADFARAATLLATNSMSRVDYDKIAGDRAEAEAAVGVAEAVQKTAQLNLDFTRVTVPELYVAKGRLGTALKRRTGPIIGVASRRYVDPGNLVKADDTLLTNIVTLDPMYASFDVDERTVLRLGRLKNEGKKFKSLAHDSVDFRIGLADDDGFPYQGTIDFVDNKFDSGTGTLRMRGIFDNPKGILKPGLFVRVRLMIGNKHRAILVAERALVTDQGQKFLYVVNQENKAIYRQIKIGALHEDRTSFTVAAKAKISCDGKACKLSDIEAGLKTRVAIPKDGTGLVTQLEALKNKDAFESENVPQGANTIEATLVRITGRQLILTHGTRLRVIEKGLSPGEKVIVSGLQRVRDGIKVDPHFKTSGKIQSRDGDKRELVVAGKADAKNYTFTLDEQAKVYLNDRAGQLTDLEAGDDAVVYWEQHEDNRLATEVRAKRK